MKRDVDLLRQLLLNLERRGAEYPLDAVRADLPHDTDERIRHQLRLAIDAGWIKDVEQPAGGVPSIRLTHAGHEFLELCQSDTRWQEAKTIVTEQTGGLSLALLRSLLARRAWQDVIRVARRGRLRRVARNYRERQGPAPWLDSRYNDLDADGSWDDDQVRMVRERPDYHERFRVPFDWDEDLYGDIAAELEQGPPRVALPKEVI